MAMTGQGMADAVYAALESEFAGLSQEKKDTIKASMAKTYGAIVTYLQGNVDVYLVNGQGVIPPGAINTAGTAVAQSSVNPVPITTSQSGLGKIQ
jgi:hypothetical protein